MTCVHESGGAVPANSMSHDHQLADELRSLTDVNFATAVVNCVQCVMPPVHGMYSQ
jgi:hypothetical protein